jgi:hypothetical protein
MKQISEIVHLVSIIMRMYHDARSPERKKKALLSSVLEQ